MAELFDLYVGSDTGLLKALSLEKKTWCNVNKPSSTDRKLLLSERQIEYLCWSSEEQSEVCLGLTNQTVIVYDVEKKDFIKNYHFPSGVEKDTLVSFAKFNKDYILCTKSGVVKVWSADENDETKCVTEIKAGDNLDSMRQNPWNKHLIATGGPKNDLKIWDINNPSEPVFRAKNVRNDFLNLEVPVWVADMSFLPDTDLLATCTGHHQIRVYEPSKQRRPVIDFEWEEYPLKCMALRPNGYHIMVGNVRGEMGMFDIRGKGYLVHKYKGGAGSIRSVACHPSQNVVASCGLDRFVRIHDINTHKLLQKFYLKSKLNCLLFSSRTIEGLFPKFRRPPRKKNVEVAVTEKNESDNEENGVDVWEQIADVKTKKRQSEDDTNTMTEQKKKKGKGK